MFGRPRDMDGARFRLRVGGVRAMEGGMLKVILCDRSVPREEVDQWVRDDRLRLKVKLPEVGTHIALPNTKSRLSGR